MLAQLKRREFMTLLGGAAAWLWSGQMQQAAMPTIGVLNTASPDGYTERLRAFRRGLRETGLVEGENVAVEYGWAEYQSDRLLELAAEMVRQRVTVIVTTGVWRAIARFDVPSFTVSNDADWLESCDGERQWPRLLDRRDPSRS